MMIAEERYVLLTSKELFLLRQAVRIATEDDSLTGFASMNVIQKLADKLDKAIEATAIGSKRA